jgi:hypothetical protein
MNVHYSAICDGCDKYIYGVRHKCLDCPDWDYCSDCLKNAEFIHPHHRFMPFDGCCRGDSRQAQSASSSTNSLPTPPTYSLPTYSPLEGDQIRLLRILPTTVPSGSGHYHQDGEESDCEREDCRAITESLFERVFVQDFEWGKILRDEVCCGDACICTECDMIQCELLTVSLEEVSGAFDALSYVWGYADVKERIKVDGKTIEVTMNLEAALRRVRNTEKAELLWVDAVCINQQDVEEKNIQVMRMKDIYTMCGRVLVWLGDAIIDGTRNDRDGVEVAIKAMSFLKTAHRIVRGKDTVGKLDYQKLFMSSAGSMQPFEDPSTVGLPKVGAPEWESLSKFLSRPWFSRVWIIQEASSVDDTLLMVGKNARLGWGQLSQAVNWFIARAYPDNIDGLRILSNISMIETCRRYKTPTLMRRLDQISRFNSTVPHDKIYAVLGLSIESLTPEKYPRLRIDYARDWEAVFRDVARHCIEMPGSYGPKPTLHILSSVRQERDDEGYFAWDKGQSSWVPKWDKIHSNCAIVQRMSHFTFQTTYDTEPCIVESQDDRILSLKGIVVDRIAKVYTHLDDIHNDHDPMFSLNQFRAVIEIWKAILWGWEVNGRGRYSLNGEAFAKVITGGSACGPPETGSPGQYFTAYYEFGLQYAKEEEPGTLPRFSAFSAPNKRDIESPCMEDISSEEALERLSLMALRFNIAVDIERAIFVTETGYIGSGPPITRVGDEVCVLYGGKTPFVVQKVTKGPNCPEWLDLDMDLSTSSVEKFKGSLKSWNPFQKKKKLKECTPAPAKSHALLRTDCYRLVGECYVEGLQKGEALDLRDKGDLHEKVLHLV